MNTGHPTRVVFFTAFLQNICKTGSYVACVLHKASKDSGNLLALRIRVLV